MKQMDLTTNQPVKHGGSGNAYNVVHVSFFQRMTQRALDNMQDEPLTAVSVNTENGKSLKRLAIAVQQDKTGRSEEL